MQESKTVPVPTPSSTPGEITLSDIEALVGKDVDVPPIPVVARKVMELVNDPYTSASIIKKAISSDQALAARVLRIANSAFYSPRETVSDMVTAIRILGFNTIKELVVGASLKGVYKNMGLLHKMLWEHSIAVAVGARVISRQLRVTTTEGTMVAGLLHDIGKVLMLQSHQDLYQQVIERVYNEGASFIEAEEQIFGYNHTQVGLLLVQKWNFSVELGLVVQNHHLLDFTGMPPAVGRLIAMVNLSDLIAKRLGLGYRRANDSVDLPGSPAAAALRSRPQEMDETVCDTLVQETKTSFEKEKGIFM
ncbi:MAG: HDOD domain-containing protein [Pseudomonadota bacterium]